MSDLYTAKFGGFFEKAAVQGEIAVLANGNIAMSALLAGTADISGVNVLSLGQARQRGIPLQVIALGAEYNTARPTAALMVANDSPIRKAADLNDKTIAVNELKAIAQIAVQSWIDRNGGDSKTVHFVELPFSTVAAALGQRRIDAGFVSEPFVTIASNDARVLGRPYDGIAPRFPIAAWACTQDWLNAHLDLAHRLHDALHDAAVWANAHHDETAQIMSSATKIDLPVLKASTRASFSEQVNIPATQQLLDVALRYGSLTAPLAAATLFPREIWK